jgi:hypothetical protein
MSMRNEAHGLNERRESNGIDKLIDDAARQIVGAEPSAALRSGIRERIDRRSSPWMSLPAFAGAGALVVVVLVVGRALLGTPGEPDRARPTHASPAIQRAATDGPDKARPTIEPERSERPERLERSERLSRRLAADVTAPPQEEDPVIPPLVIEPLTTEPLRAVQIAVDVRSGVTPIEIEPLQIEPLRSE